MKMAKIESYIYWSVEKLLKTLPYHIEKMKSIDDRMMISLDENKDFILTTSFQERQEKKK